MFQKLKSSTPSFKKKSSKLWDVIEWMDSLHYNTEQISFGNKQMKTSVLFYTAVKIKYEIKAT